MFFIGHEALELSGSDKRDSKRMKILHLCSYYVGSKVYKNLFEELSTRHQVLTQNVFIPVRDNAHIGSNRSGKRGIHFYYFKCLNWITRLFFSSKLIALVFVFFRFDRDKRVLDNCSVIHAHTLYSDGYLAYVLNRIYDIPYVITVRTTDVGIFENYLPHWRFFTKKVIRNAQCLVFLSAGHKFEIEKTYSTNLPKNVLLPNGIDDYWVEHARLKKTQLNADEKRAIYIGAIVKNKNIKEAIYAFFSCQPSHKSSFIVIGGNYDVFRRVFGELPSNLLGRVKFIDCTEDKDIIREYLKASDILIMPSKLESFGLVYLEAISQCTPVVYSVGQGIDGLFPDGFIGYGCNPGERHSIAAAIVKTLAAFPYGMDFSDVGRNPVAGFSWKNTATELLGEVY